MIKRGTQTISKIYRGAREIVKVYRGSHLVWEKGTGPVTLDGIYIYSPPSTPSYQSGDALDLSGLLVYATYSDGTEEDVTGECVFTPDEGDPVTDSTGAGYQRVEVSYSAGSITVTTDFDVEVQQEPGPGPDTGTGTVTYVWDEDTRSVSVRQTSAAGNASFSFDADTQGLTVTGGAEPYD